MGIDPKNPKIKTTTTYSCDCSSRIVTEVKEGNSVLYQAIKKESNEENFLKYGKDVVKIPTNLDKDIKVTRYQNIVRIDYGGEFTNYNHFAVFYKTNETKQTLQPIISTKFTETMYQGTYKNGLKNVSRIAIKYEGGKDLDSDIVNKNLTITNEDGQSKSHNTQLETILYPAEVFRISLKDLANQKTFIFNNYEMKTYGYNSADHHILRGKPVIEFKK